MLRHALCSFLLCCGVALSAADVPVEGWLAKADSLRTIGLDAASLDLLKSAQHEFEANGDPCSSALLAARRLLQRLQNLGRSSLRVREIRRSEE